MKLELTQLFNPIPNENNDYVTYINQLTPRCIFNDSKLEQLFEKHKVSIMKIVETEIFEYVNDDFLCNDMENMFPRKCYLTGEWYVSEFYFGKIGYLSVNTAFVGTDLSYKDDYLGLEVILHYDEDADEFCYDTINSQAL